MSTEIIIRRAQLPDLDGAARLGAGLALQHHQTDPDRYFLPERAQQGYAWWFAKELQRPAAVILVAARGPEIVGYSYGAAEERDWNLLIDRHGVIHDLFVAEDARRLGVGARLLDTMIQELEALGAPRIVLYTMISNERAQHLFRARGFRPTLLEMTRNTPEQSASGG